MSDEERREVAAGLRSANLADLIYQGDMSQGRRDIVACDRDALLELADEMVAEKGFEPPRSPHTNTSRFVRVEILHGYARRIREACGEVVE